ncbi:MULTISPECIES: hypothetical protein [Moorena]|uniref:Uncharacterized protein n=1 Tax=Moorena producens 3L TaxID=489825 RepID=F4Y1P2_9CYAN|nr:MULTISPECIES: hypothetical protein [Moorena]EGJ29184.1 hypothetical protein LYNGBM3L_64470 [Moorena producens 3L]NEP32309.1 hypothetical protein [Moorena sp. SIO3B2]NEP67481.1 hypothetical protein [Moorena sp. SIO3A5]NEQ15688.1 hypothetical protein [Moorena sp. SIO3E2]
MPRESGVGNRESGVGSGATRGEFNSPTESAPRESGVGKSGKSGKSGKWAEFSGLELNAIGGRPRYANAFVSSFSIALSNLMRYTGFFPSCLLPVPDSRFPIPDSLSLAFFSWERINR